MLNSFLHGEKSRVLLTETCTHCKSLISPQHRWGQLVLSAINSKCQQKFWFIFHSWNIQPHLFVSGLDRCRAGIPVALQTKQPVLPAERSIVNEPVSSLILADDAHGSQQYTNHCHLILTLLSLPSWRSTLFIDFYIQNVFCMKTHCVTHQQPLCEIMYVVSRSLYTQLHLTHITLNIFCLPVFLCCLLKTRLSRRLWLYSLCGCVRVRE